LWTNKQLSYKTKTENAFFKAKWLPTAQHENTKEHTHQEIAVTLSAITASIS